MKNVIAVIRILLGLGMVVFGLNKFLEFIPMPEVTPEMGAWMGAIMATGFLMKMVAVIEIATGLMFLVNKYVSLSLVVLLPVMLIAFLSHLLLDIAGVGGSAIFLFLIIFLMFQNKEAYKGLLKA